MRALLFLVLLFGIPSEGVTKEYWQLSCEDFESVTRNLSSSNMDQSIKHEVLIELIRATDPACFE